MNDSILVIEDDPSWREILTMILERACFRVDSAVSAPAARACLQARPYVAIILDISLSSAMDKSGLDLLADAELRSHFDSAVVIILSGFTSQDSLKRGFMSGVADVLPKQDFDDAVFVEELMRYLHERSEIDCAAAREAR
jgi:DNA-binding response OmpR family regulator